MAIKTFTSGAVLTAADTNTYLANSGLVYIKSQTVGTAVASVTVTGAFSTDYDDYKIIYTGGTSSGGVVQMTLGAATTQYYSQLIYAAYSAATVLANVADNNNSQWSFVGYGTTNFVTVNVELTCPFKTTRTTMTSNYISDINAGRVQGLLNDATSHTSFKFTGAGGSTLTGGTITVYGYRKA